MLLAQDILEWPSDWVAAQMGWAAGPSVSMIPGALPPFPGWQGVWISNQNGVLSTAPSGPPVSQVWGLVAHCEIALTPFLHPRYSAMCRIMHKEASAAMHPACLNMQ